MGLSSLGLDKSFYAVYQALAVDDLVEALTRLILCQEPSSDGFCILNIVF